MQKRIKIFLSLIVCTTSAFSQFQVKNYFSLTGKKDITYNAIAQDNDGFLILGTSDGVYKFDGKKAVPFLKENAILKKEITSIFIDSKETIWLGTKGGKVYSVFGNKLDSLDLPVKDGPEKITSFYETNTCLCIGTYGNGLFTYQNNVIKHYDVDNGLSDNVIYKITGDKENTIWCGTDAGLTQISNLSSKFTFKIISNKDGLPDNIVRDINYAGNKLLIAMQDSGICYYNFKKNKIEQELFFTNWSLGTILSASESSSNQLLIVTEKNGLLRLNKGVLSVYNYENYIQNISINQCFIDKSNQIWLSSKKGLSQFSEKRYNLINTFKGFADDKILAIATDNDNAIWIGTSVGISKVMLNNDGIYVVNRIQDLNKYAVSCAARAPDGNMWFGTYGNGIIVLSSETNKSININASDDHLANDNISNIFFSDNNTVYISTLGGGLIKGSIKSHGKYKSFEIEKEYTENEGLGSAYVYAAVTDNAGKLYVGTDGGGLQVLENDKFINLTEKYKTKSNTVFSLCKDKYNNIWASTNLDGVIKFNGSSLTSVTQSSVGLRDEQPQQLIASGNTVFAFNSKGIDKINCQTNKVSYYDLYEGEIEPNLNAVFLSDNKIYSGTNNGILVYRTNSEHNDSIKPTVFIKSLSLNYKPFPMDSISEFHHNQNNFSFSFDGIWLKNPDKLTFRYRLSGLEEDWTYSNEGKTVNYNNLNPGDYIFIVQSKNDEDIWSEANGFAFIISTPIWKRWWFWVTVFTIITIGIYLFIKVRLKALQRENLLLEQRVKERTHQLEKQAKIIELKNVELEQLSLVASKTDNVVLILDPNGKLEYVNESFVRQSNISIDEMKNIYGETIYELSNNPNIREIIADAIANKRSVNYESLNAKANTETEIWESSTLTPIFNEDGALKKIIIIDTDVSERKRQEQIISQKNKDITDSISYAQKIQHAILPHDDVIKTHLPKSFILYMTKDIVSGDFYWFTHFKDFSIIAAVDCTGHGVPGAFMSLIGYNILNKIVNEQKITDPKDILFELNNGILEVLHKNASESKDGMDTAICKINHKQHTIEYSGAMRPLWTINNFELKEIKADKIPIGTKQKDRDETIAYTTHTLKVEKGDSFYIFTDGYADQFGGPKDKKYSTGKFKDLLKTNSNKDFETQLSVIKAEHLSWKGENEQVDDILVIGFTI